MEKIKIDLPDSMVKDAVAKGLEYSLQNMLAQIELKYKMRIEAISIASDSQTGLLQTVKVSWQETGEGIRTNDEVRQLLQQTTKEKLTRITDKLGANG